MTVNDDSFTSWKNREEIAESGETPVDEGEDDTSEPLPLLRSAQAHRPSHVVADDPALVMLQAQIAAANVDKGRAGWRTSVPQPTVVPFTAGKSYVWILSTS